MATMYDAHEHGSDVSCIATCCILDSSFKLDCEHISCIYYWRGWIFGFEDRAWCDDSYEGDSNTITTTLSLLYFS